MAQWSTWSTCTKSCGGGTQNRTRQINIPGSCGGEACASARAGRALCRAGAST
jgi:hypothetical protein